MQEDIAKLPLITKVKQNYLDNADVTNICQIIKHYREITGINFTIEFKSSVEASYATSKVENVKFKDNRFEISLNYPALLGINGVMPRMFTIRLLNDYHDGDSAGCDFLQMFENRYYTLAIASHNKYNLIRQKEEESFSRRNTQYKISDLLGTLLGVNIGFEFRYLDKRSLIRFISFLGAKSNNIATLLKLLRSYFSYDFKAQYAPLQVRKLSKSVLTKITTHEKGNNILGENIQLGSRVNMYGNFLDISIVVSDMAQYEQMNNTPNLFNAIDELITFYLGNDKAYVLNLLVNKNFLPQSKIGLKDKKLCLGKNLCLSASDKDFMVKIPIKTSRYYRRRM